MARNQNKRLGPVLLQADVDALTALRNISDYTPANSAYALQIAEDALTNMKNTQDAELAAQNVLGTARDASAVAEWEFHNLMLGVKEQVIAQYGKSSDELQALGLKKKSEYKAPGARKKASA